MRLFLSIIFMAGVLSGCANWFESSSRPKPTPLTPIHATVPLAIKWSHSLDKNTLPASFPPVYDQGEVIVAHPKGSIHTLRADTGGLIAQLDLKRSLSSGVGLNAQLFLVGTAEGTLLAVDRSTGQSRWEQRLTSVTLEVPQVSSEVVVVRTNDDRITGFSLEGKQLWSVPHLSPQLTVRDTGSLALVGNEVVLAGITAGKIQVISLANGNILWEGLVANPSGATELERVTDVVTRPVYDGQYVCAVAYQGRIACFDAHNGNLLWAREISSSRGLAIDARNLYVTDEDDAVWAFDRTTGRNFWKQEALKYRTVSAPALVDGYLLVVDHEGTAHLLSSENGSIVGRITIGTSGQIGQALALGNQALVEGANGRVVMLSVKQATTTP